MMRQRPGAGMMPGEPPPGAGRQRIIAELLRRPDVQKLIGITEEQRRKLGDIRFNTAKAAIEGRSALEIRRLELARLMQSESPDRAAIDKKLQEIAQAQGSLMRSTVNAQLDNRSVYTKEQREKMKQAVQKYMQDKIKAAGQEPGPKPAARPPAPKEIPKAASPAPKPPAQ